MLVHLNCVRFLPKLCGNTLLKECLFDCTVTEELDLPVKPDKKWVHMDKVEYDKLSWLKDLPFPKTDNNEVVYLHVVLQ